MNVLLKVILVTALSVIGASIVNAAGSGSSPKGKPFVEIQGQFVEVQGQIKSLEEQMDDLVGRVDSIEFRVAANETAIAGLDASNVIIQQKIGDLIDVSASNSAEIADALAQIIDLQSQIDDLKLAPDVNAQVIADMAAQMNTFQTFITSNTEGLLTLQSELSNNYALISAFQAQTDQINIEIAKKQDVLTGQCPNGTALVYFDGLGEIECESNDATAGIQRNTLTKIVQVTHKQSTFNPRTCWSYTTNPFTGVRDYFSYECGYTSYSGGTGQGVLTCPDGSYLTGGGFINNHPDFVSILESHSARTEETLWSPQSWIVRASNRSNTTSYDVYVIADCVTLLP